MIDLCQCFCKGMKKIYTYQMFLCFLNGERYKGSDNIVVLLRVFNSWINKTTTALSLATNVVTCA